MWHDVLGRMMAGGDVNYKVLLWKYCKDISVGAGHIFRLNMKAIVCVILAYVP